ncbi:oxidoreductase [Pradoshia sp.]
MKPIKTAIIGFGLSGSKFHAPFIQDMKEFELSAIVVRQPEKIRSQVGDIPVFDSIEKVLEEMPEIELVIISTPTPTHYSTAKTAIQAGKHLIVEKPFVVTIEEGEELIALAKEHNTVLSVYQNRRWDGDYLTVKSLIESGKLGNVHTIEMNWDRYRKEVRDRWKEADIPGSGVFYDIAPHMLDQALCLWGEPYAIYGNMQKQREGAKATDYFHVVLEYEQGSIIIRGGTLVAAQTPRFVVHGTEGSYIIYGHDPQEAQLQAGIMPNDEGYGIRDENRMSIFVKPDGTQETIEVAKGNYADYFKQVAEAIHVGGAVPVTGEEGLAVIRLIEAGIESAKEKKIVINRV